MTSKEPPSSPPEGKWCALCEREIGYEDESVELRTRAVVCMKCWKAQPRRGANRHG